DLPALLEVTGPPRECRHSTARRAGVPDAKRERGRGRLGRQQVPEGGQRQRNECLAREAQAHPDRADLQVVLDDPARRPGGSQERLVEALEIALGAVLTAVRSLRGQRRAQRSRIQGVGCSGGFGHPTASAAWIGSSRRKYCMSVYLLRAGRSKDARA